MKQSEALKILKLGHNVFLTGPAGAGKTYVLNKFISYLKQSSVHAAVTASTGIAATHINGMTIHSWAGIGIKDEITAHDLKFLKDKSTFKKRMKAAKVLIIDEISMLHGKRLDMVDTVCREFKDKNKPFGGLQVVLCGDLFQLPPVTKQEPIDFVFKSKAWKTMRLQVCYLEEQHRQDDGQFLSLLNAIRHSEVEEDHFDILKDRMRSPGETNHTKLYTHNQDVDSINLAELKNLGGKTKRYSMTFSGKKTAAASLAKNCLAPEELELKIGSKVMFVANSQTGQFANGTLGEVVGFSDDGFPAVQVGKKTIETSLHSWKTLDGDKTIAEVFQVPLRLAWAITIHKSQGMSLDAAEIDLSKSFEPGMGYVALSRVRSLEGLFIKGINNTAMVVNPEVTQLDEQLKERSDQLSKQIKNINNDKLQLLHNKVTAALQPEESKLLKSYNLDLFDELSKWRARAAKKKSYPAYVIFGDETLKFIAALMPQTQSEFAKIKGVGPQKLEEYATEVLEITKKYIQT